MESFDEFLAARGPALLRTAYLICGDRTHAEDLFQGAMARLLVHWSRVANGEPEAYARRILVNATINWRQRLRTRETTVAALPEPVCGDFTTAHADRDEMWRALAVLPTKQRAVLVLRYYEDLTEAQSAAVLGCSVGTVKSQHAKALAKLRAARRPELPTSNDLTTTTTG